MLKFLFKNGSLSALIIWAYTFAHGLLNETLIESASFFSQATGASIYMAVALRAVLVMIVCITWSEAIRFRYSDEGSTYVGILLAVMVSIALPGFWIIQELLAMLIGVLIFRRLLSSLEVITPTGHLFEIGVLVAVLALIRIEYALFLFPITLISLILGRVDLRLLLLPFLAFVTSAWIVWGVLDLLDEKWIISPGSLNSMLNPDFSSSINNDFLKIGSLVWLPVLIWAGSGTLSEKGSSRAVDRQIVQSLFWSMLFLLLLSIFSLTGGTAWWPISIIPASLLISKDLGKKRRGWQTDLLLLIWLCSGFLYLVL